MHIKYKDFETLEKPKDITEVELRQSSSLPVAERGNGTAVDVAEAAMAKLKTHMDDLLEGKLCSSCSGIKLSLL